MRLFVALEIGDPDRAAPDHLTLAFLGEVPADRVPSLVAVLEAVADTVSPFELVLEGVGAFPSRERPRVVWVGAREGGARVEQLAEVLRAGLTGAGFSLDHERFHPHVTLFRVRSPRDLRRARDLLDGAAPPPPPRVAAVREVVLKSSRLTAGGPIHETLARAALRGGEDPSRKKATG